MKKKTTILILLGLFICNTQGQIVIRFTKYYLFSHDKGLTTLDAFSKGMDSSMGSYSTFTTCYFDTTRMTYQTLSYDGTDSLIVNGYIYNFMKLENEYGRTDYGFVVQSPKRKNPTIIGIFFNTPTERMYLERTLSSKDPNRYYGVQSIVVNEF